MLYKTAAAALETIITTILLINRLPVLGFCKDFVQVRIRRLSKHVLNLSTFDSTKLELYT